MERIKAHQRALARMLLLGLSLIAFVAGAVLIGLAIWQNNNTADGHYYWPFMDLFGLFVLGCGFVVLAINALVWRRFLSRQPPTVGALPTLVVLVVLSPGATILLGVLILHAIVFIPGI